MDLTRCTTMWRERPRRSANRNLRRKDDEAIQRVNGRRQGLNYWSSRNHKVSVGPSSELSVRSMRKSPCNCSRTLINQDHTHTHKCPLPVRPAERDSVATLSTLQCARPSRDKTGTRIPVISIAFDFIILIIIIYISWSYYSTQLKFIETR